MEANRSLIAHFLDTTPAATARLFKRLGDGITTATMNYNPQSVTEAYIHQDVAVTRVDSYQPSFPVEQTAFPGDSVYDFIDEIRQGGPSIGGNDLTQLVEVRLYETAVGTGEYPATRWNVAIQIDSFGGDGGAKGKLNFTINIKGDSTQGKFAVATGVFTVIP